MPDSQKDEKTIFREAVKLKTPAERGAYIDKVCGADVTLKARLMALLQAHEEKGDFLEALIEESDVTLDETPVSEGSGTVIGRYKLLEKIGEGGMAVVYMSEQEKPIRRKVALKIIKLGMDTKSVIARFEVERQVLAMMEHPNIACVLDAGCTETGRPYFVMELVKGLSITEYCDRNKLNTQERLELFVPICNAVHHAHQKGIIHRDLKPSNIMVTLHDGDPVPKVIDFGIAKATSHRLTEKTLFTRYAEMIGTPEYMSPEQAEMSGLDIDTRTDIYSLGVVLYELLAGALPFDPETFRSAGFGEIQRIICEEEPPHPSTRLSSLGEQAQKIAETRRTDVATLTRRLHNELEWIPLKAMRKDRTRRYRSACEFADDINNYLNQAPLIAGPESAAYRIKKLLRKYRVSVMTTAIILTVLFVGFVTITYLYVRVRQAQNAVARLERTVAADRRLTTAQRLQAEGRYKAALDEFEGYLSSEEAGPKALLLHASLLLDLGRFAQAGEELTQLTDGPPETAGPAHCLLAQVYIGTDPARAKRHQRIGESLLPRTAEAYSLRGMTANGSQETFEWLSKALELDPSHYPSRKARALASYAVKDYATMTRDVEAMIVSRPRDAFGYALLAIAERETRKLEAAIEDHYRAIALCDVDAELPEFYDQRRKTYMQMGNYEAALKDAKRCVELNPNEFSYKFNLFTALFSLGEYEAAKRHYEEIAGSEQRLRERFTSWASRYVFDLLSMGRRFELSAHIVSEAPFSYMQVAAEQYRICEARATPLVSQAFAQPGWSPDGKQLVYGRTDWYAWPDRTLTAGAPMIYESSGIEILDLETGRIRQLAGAGKDPAWSPDGRFIAFNQVSHRSGYNWQAQLWLVPAGGGAPRRLSRGGWPIWSDNPGRLYFHDLDAFYRLNIDDPNGTRERIVSCPPFCALSPDEKYVAYQNWGEVRIVDVATGNIEDIWTAPPPEGMKRLYLRWSPDGKEILIAGGHESDLGLWSYDVKLRRAWQVFPSPAVLANVSPDKTKLAIALREHIGGIWLASLDPNLPIRDSMSPALTREQYFRRNCKQFAESIHAGTYRSDASGYLREFITCVCELGQTYYRNAQYQDAFETLSALKGLLDALGEKCCWADVAFMAMSLHQLGRKHEAEAAMEQLRRLHEGDMYSSQRRFLYAAEKLFAGEESETGKMWRCLEAGRLREAAMLLDDLRSPMREGNMETATYMARIREALAEEFYERGRRCRHNGGDYVDAMADYEMASQVVPNRVDALCDLAWLQAACPIEEFRDPARAIENATRACELTQWADHGCVATLAAVCAETGDFAAAVEWQKKAIALLSPSDTLRWQTDYASRLNRYQSNERYDKGNLWSFSTGRMVGWWKFDEDSGGTAVDSSGNDCSGRLIGNSQWQPSGGKINGALKFNGDDCVEVSSEYVFDITEQITVAAWIKVNSFNKWWQAIVTKGDSSWRLFREGDSDTVSFHCDGVRSQQTPWATSKGHTSVNDGRWHHVAGVYDGQRILLYIDGEPEGTCEASGRIKTNNYPVAIGENAEQPGRQWNGLIDDVRIYEWALMEDEVAILAH